MYTCKTCGKSFRTASSLGGHSNIHRNDHIILTHLQEQVILGSLIGDMWIYINGSKTRNPEVGVKHSTKQRDYIMWKYSMLQDIARGEPIEFYGSGFGKRYKVMQFSSKSLPCLRSIYNATHSIGKKCISKEWLSMIKDPIALAVWYMDDGCRLSKFKSSFAIGTMPNNECKLLQSFVGRWGLESDVREYAVTHFDNGIIRTGIQKYLFVNMSELKKIVDPYIIPSMRYKVEDVIL